MCNLNEILKMRTKNFIIELIANDNDERFYIVREMVPQQPPVTVYVSDSSEELAKFLGEVTMK